MTPAEFRAARQRLGLSQQAAASILGVDARTVRRWEQHPNDKGARPPHPTAARVMTWLAAGALPDIDDHRPAAR